MNSEDMYNVISEISPDILDEAEKYTNRKDFTPFKIFAAAACILFLICGSIPVMAACNNETAMQIMCALVPSLANRLRPVCMSCENNGIIMEVVGMELNNDKANILVSMRDTEGNRLTDSCDLFDSYGIRTNSASVAGASSAGFDPATGTAYFLLQIDQMGVPIKEGEKIVFSVGEILPGKEYLDMELDMIDLSDLPGDVPVTGEYDYRGGSTTVGDLDLRAVPVLIPDSSDETVLTEGVSLLGYGISDGVLHVQLKYTDIKRTDDHGFVYLIDPSGEKIVYHFDVSWFDENRVDSYEEYCFIVPEEGFDGYKICCEFWTCNEGPIDGPWSVTIPAGMLE